MVFNTTYNNISAISWLSVLLVDMYTSIANLYHVFNLVISYIIYTMIQILSLFLNRREWFLSTTISQIKTKIAHGVSFFARSRRNEEYAYKTEHISFVLSKNHSEKNIFIFQPIDLFILKNMDAAIIDFRVCPPLVKCKNLMFSGFIDTLMYGFSSTGVTIYYYFGLKFNDNTCCEVICKRRYNDNDLMTTNKLPGMYFSF